MCSISGSFSVQTLSELVELNRYRGELFHSISLYNVECKTISTIRKQGPIDTADILIPNGCYCIVHQQAPTTDNKSMDCVHPAQFGASLLWHNGILKAKEVKRLKKKLKSKSTWDTELLLQDLMKEGIPLMIDGSFACVYYDGSEVFLFRNAISPLFEDADLNISSTKFEGGMMIRPDTMYRMNFLDRKLDTTKRKFITMENPYFM